MTSSSQNLFILISIVMIKLTALSHGREAMPYLEAHTILEHSCLECHNSESTKGGLNLETRALMIEGGETDSAVDFKNPEQSLILERVRLPHDDDEFMPPSSKKKTRSPLSESQITALETWIHKGAPWPTSITLKHREPTPEFKLVDAISISIHPSSISLETKRDYHRFIVLAHRADGTTVDVSENAKINIANSTLVRLEKTTVYPLQNGETSLTIRYRHHQETIPVTIKNAHQDRPITFQQDVVPVLTAAGCNTGSCHGAARGQDGFMLSLFGYDPKGDHHRITREMAGRRINLAIPEDSLLLTKATNSVPHSGNKLFEKGSPFYNTLLEWIQNGAKTDPAEVTLPTSIKVEPAEFVIQGTEQALPLTVTATYSDGTDRDVTTLSSFTTSNESSLAVGSTTGLVESKKQGEAFLMARFHTFTEGSQGIVIPENLNYQRPELSEGNYIDKLVHEKLHKLRILPSDLCSDEIFIRRVYLDLIGRLPEIPEQHPFLKSSAPDKRARLIDKLIDSEEFTNIWVMKWAELMQIRSTGRAANTITPKASRLWHNWLHDQISSKRPFNKIIYDLIASRGGTFDSPATNFYKLEKDPKKITENVAQIFMGTRLQCAQCHNHPFDRWTQDEYFGFAAFFSQIKRKGAADAAEQIIYDGQGEIKHPVTNQVAKPRFLGGEEVKVEGNLRRHTVADWLTKPDNPWFAKNVSNIIWSHFFGIGIVEPVDDVRVSNPASNPQLLEALADSLARADFSIHHLAREICNSHTYQRSSHTNPTNAGDERNFSKSRIRRLRAEVLLDTIARTTGTNNKFTGLERGSSATKIPDGNTTNYFLQTFGRATRKTVCSCEVKMEPNLSQALHLLNGEATHQRIQRGGLIKTLLHKKKKTPEEIIETLYRRTVTRSPNESEKSKLLAHFTPELSVKEQQNILEDIFWALLNSKEYLFNH